MDRRPRGRHPTNEWCCTGRNEGLRVCTLTRLSRAQVPDVSAARRRRKGAQRAHQVATGDRSLRGACERLGSGSRIRLQRQGVRDRCREAGHRACRRLVEVHQRGSSKGPGSTIYVGNWAGLTAKSPTVQVTVALYSDTGAFQLAEQNLKQGLPGPPKKVAGIGSAAYEAKGALSVGIHFAVGKYIVFVSLNTIGRRRSRPPCSSPWRRPSPPASSREASRAQYWPRAPAGGRFEPARRPCCPQGHRGR